MSNPYIFTAVVSKIVDGDTMYVTDINLGFGLVHRGDTGRGIILRLNYDVILDGMTSQTHAHTKQSSNSAK